MKKSRFILFLALTFGVVSTFSQSKKSDNKYTPEWHLLLNDSIYGANVIPAFTWLQSQKLKPKKKIIVGVIDSGTDTTHLYLKNALWHNKKRKTQRQR
ncbi:hypothetical protein [Coprobacter sp.]